MNLTYYGIEVGKIKNITLLDIKNEFQDEERTTINSAFDIEQQSVETESVKVYDIILAGVEA